MTPDPTSFVICLSDVPGMLGAVNVSASFPTSIDSPAYRLGVLILNSIKLPQGGTAFFDFSSQPPTSAPAAGAAQEIGQCPDKSSTETPS